MFDPKRTYPTTSDWFKANVPPDEMLYKDGFYAQRQMFHVCDKLFNVGCSEPDEIAPLVVSYHTSKSIKLPVVAFQRPGLTVIARDNFYDIKFSVESDRSININPEPLFDESASLSACYFDGFDARWVHGSWWSNRKKFSVSVPGQVGAVFVDRVTQAYVGVK